MSRRSRASGGNSPSLFFATSLAVALLAGGCSRPEYPTYTLTPDPKDAEQLVVTLKNAPEGIYASSAYASYRLTNKQCLPVVTNLQGVQYAPYTRIVESTPHKVDETTYVLTVYRDQMEHRDYYGRGVCEWTLGFAAISFRRRDAPSPVYYAISASPERLQMDGAMTRYYRAKNSPLLDDGLPFEASSFGEDIFKSLSEDEQARTFSITISSVK
ncbi:hypothetical protein [Stenotrophomonas sp.]|uniref:hypothetical protein n=1 Tax=Stenotrophomonas sp. TaxID=69392 RepID=UPI002FC84841